MCRFVAIISNDPLLLADILTRPRMSLIRQSFCSQERARLPDGAQAQMGRHLVLRTLFLPIFPDHHVLASEAEAIL